MSEETKQNEQIKKPEMQSAVEIRKILKDVVASGYTPIYVNSLEKEVGFKEIYTMKNGEFIKVPLK